MNQTLSFFSRCKVTVDLVELELRDTNYLIPRDKMCADSGEYSAAIEDQFDVSAVYSRSHRQGGVIPQLEVLSADPLLWGSDELLIYHGTCSHVVEDADRDPRVLWGGVVSFHMVTKILLVSSREKRRTGAELTSCHDGPRSLALTTIFCASETVGWRPKAQNREADRTMTAIPIAAMMKVVFLLTIQLP